MKLFSLVVGLFATQMVFAAGNQVGCGLGTELFKGNPKLGAQVMAATTNGSSGNQTFGVTSGTSGCTSAGGFVKNSKEIEYFVEANQEQLKNQIVQGSGEKLATLAGLYNCNQNEFFGLTQKNFSKIVPSSSVNSAEMVQNLNTVVKTSNCVL